MNKKIIGIVIIAIVVILVVGGCIMFNNSNKDNEEKANGNKTNAVNANNDVNNNANDNENNNNEETQKSKILVAYFSRADENYAVGTVEVGNTEIMAKNIAELTGGDLFKIEPVQPYPASYDETTEIAQQEKNQNSRPELKNEINNIDEYDTIFIGYPIWWSDMPMCVYTFLEDYDFSNKTIIPFNTHEGSGSSGTYATIKNKLANSNILDGLSIRGKDAREDSSKQDIEDWIKGLNF